MTNQIQFIQLNAEQLGELIAANVQKAVEPLLKQLHHTTPETRRYTRKQTAELLGVTLSTLWSKTKDGLIQSERFGRRVLYTQEAIEAALTKRNFGISTGRGAKR